MKLTVANLIELLVDLLCGTSGLMQGRPFLSAKNARDAKDFRFVGGMVMNCRLEIIDDGVVLELVLSVSGENEL
jgi:hypothetical protein